jgi:CheY-like chemotaxis protein
MMQDKRYMSSLGALALSFGYAVGWGAFVMPGTTFLPSAGPLGTVIGVLLGALAMGIFAINYHRLTTRYTGCGISKEDLKQITSPYVRVDSKLARHGGTGLGLALCRKLAIAMGGELSIDSALGKGSIFTITISNVKVTNAEPVEEDEPAIDLNVVKTDHVPQPERTAVVKEEKQVEPVASKRILIVDDLKVNLMVLKTMLKKMGTYDVVMAKDGKEALDILTSAGPQFALVLTDMWMPVLDGEGLVRAIRADEHLATIPVHVVTADTEMESKYDKIGFDGFILKPVTVDKLGAIIR